MLMTWWLLFVSIAASQEINVSTEETTLNTTTLYPVNNKTIDNHRNIKHHRNHTDIQEEHNIAVNKEIKAKDYNEEGKVEITLPKKKKVTTWSIEANYAVPKDKQSQFVDAQTKDKKSDDFNGIDSKEQVSIERPKSNSEEKEFKPSPHLGSFFDDENLNLLKFSTSEHSKPVRDFVSSKELYMLNYKSPKTTYRDQIDPPYRFEGAQFLTTNNWKQTLESKPTVESSVKVPAGGLYKHSNPFREKPSADDDDHEFGLSWNEDGREVENPDKKRRNPWKNLLQLVTAFLPVGLIISALTPNVITLLSTDNDPYLSRLSRRGHSGAGLERVPAVSEACRRRLLCEIHAEENYVRSEGQSRVARKRCYKLRCEDPDTLRAVLAWLLDHRPGPAGPPPGWQHQHAGVMDHHHRSNDFT